MLSWSTPSERDPTLGEWPPPCPTQTGAQWTQRTVLVFLRWGCSSSEPGDWSPGPALRAPTADLRVPVSISARATVGNLRAGKNNGKFCPGSSVLAATHLQAERRKRLAPRRPAAGGPPCGGRWFFLAARCAALRSRARVSPWPSSVGASWRSSALRQRGQPQLSPSGACRKAAAGRLEGGQDASSADGLEPAPPPRRRSARPFRGTPARVAPCDGPRGSHLPDALPRGEVLKQERSRSPPRGPPAAASAAPVRNAGSRAAPQTQRIGDSGWAPGIWAPQAPCGAASGGKRGPERSARSVRPPAGAPTWRTAATGHSSLLCVSVTRRVSRRG